MLNSWTATLLAALAARGIDADGLAASVGVSPEMLDDPGSRIPLHLSTRLWRAAVDVTGDDAFGIEASRHIRPGSFHVLGTAFLSSPTLQAGLERAARYSRVTADVASARTRHEGDELLFVLDWCHGPERPAEEAIDAVLASIVRTARLLLGRDTNPSRVELERARPHSVGRFDGFFRCPVSFSAPETVLGFHRCTVERPIVGGSEALASATDQLLLAYLAGLDSANVADRVRAVVGDALASGEPDVALVAAELAMSPRSLQRHLADEGTSFREVLGDVRRRLADSLLDSGVSVTETAQRLGFSESASFSRAYRRWTGTSPARR